MQYKISRLENGLTVATANMPHMTSVSLGIWVGVGGRHEPARLNGVSHFIEHMLFKGTRRRSAREISQAVEGVGGYLNAFTTEENTCYFSKASHEKFDELLDVLSDMFLNSQFDPGEIKKERNVIKEELAMYLDQPQQHVQELLNELLWPDHPLGRSLTGTEESLDTLGRKELLGFHHSKYVSRATLFTVAGRLNHEHVTRRVRALARYFPQGKRPCFQPAQNEQAKPRLHLFTKETEQTQMALGIRTCSRHDDRRFTLRLLNTILGENMSSRLFQVVREDRGLAYSICSSLNFFEDAGALVISAGLDTAHLREALKLIVVELRRLINEPVSAAELQRARDYLIGQMDLSLESTESQMMWIGEQWLGYGSIIPSSAIREKLGQVTSEKIQEAAQAFFKPGNFCLALVSPLRSSKGLVQLLQ